MATDRLHKTALYDITLPYTKLHGAALHGSASYYITPSHLTLHNIT